MSLPLPASSRRHSTFGRSDGRHTGVPLDKQVIPYREPSAGKNALVQQVKALQRSSPGAKQTWWKFCSWNGKADFDPARHDAGFLQFFITTYENEKSEKLAARANSMGGSSSSSSGSSGASPSKGKGVSSGADSGGLWGKGCWGSDFGNGCSESQGKDGCAKGMMPWMAAMASMGSSMGMAMDTWGMQHCGQGIMDVSALALLGRGTGSNAAANEGEFGIMACPPPSLVNRKRAASSMASSTVTPAPAGGGLMTEEQAKEFQKSLKRSKS